MSRPNGHADKSAAARHLWTELAAQLDGDLRIDRLTRMLYAADASPYQAMPDAVALPRHAQDCERIVQFAAAHGMPIIPRAAGTSLAGQCVGAGLVVDVSRYMNAVRAIHVQARRVVVQPGVILDDLNAMLAPHGLMFAPDTSTGNRCMIGGMIGNNAAGAYSIRYGTTREHVLETEVVLADGSGARFAPLSAEQCWDKLQYTGAEGRIYREVHSVIDTHRPRLSAAYPHPEIVRRNTGYALDVLARGQPWEPAGAPFNLNALLCGSEGTLAFITEATLRLTPLPRQRILLCAHFAALDEALRATQIAVAAGAAAAELIDRPILAATRGHAQQGHNRAWIEGDPAAVLAVEFLGDDAREIESQAHNLVAALRREQLGYAFPLLDAQRATRVWELRRAGLGLLMGVASRRKAVTVIEDTAVPVSVLPDYVRRVQALMDAHGVRCVYYGHASVGLLHLRPELDLARPEDRARFEAIAAAVAALVKAYRGSLSGEHGDGRLRSPYLRTVLGDEVYALLRRVKHAFDPQAIFNPHKIVDAAPLSEALRIPLRPAPIATHFDWRADLDFAHAADKCNGAAVCRRRTGAGTMCPSYRATLEERDSTRGRAAVFRQMLTQPEPAAGMTSPLLREVLDRCLACKACKSECPAGVDMARMKAEHLQQYYDRYGVPVRTRLLARYPEWLTHAARVPRLANALSRRAWLRRLLGLSAERPLPSIARQSLSDWLLHRPATRPAASNGEVVLVGDIFTEYLEPHIGRAAVEVLEHLGYAVRYLPPRGSARVLISQGLLRQARSVLHNAIAALHPHATRQVWLLGLEPSEILTHRDEAPDLVASSLREPAQTVAARTRLFEEFIAEQISPDARRFAARADTVLVHGHCHQRSLAGMQATLQALRLLPGTQVTETGAGCCGLAGAFGYESEHYALSMQIGELALFPRLRQATADTLIVAAGTSCRQQIMAGTGLSAVHPAELFHQRLLQTD